jgi:hypothetical protein
MTGLLRDVFLVAGLTIAAGGAPPCLAEKDHVRRALDALVAAYPDELARWDGTSLHWRDGTVMRASDDSGSQAVPEPLRRASIIDQIRTPYPRGHLDKPPSVNSDPGRSRNPEFFVKMYGDCQRGEVSKHLVRVVWLPRTFGKSIYITSVNHVDQHLRAISAELDALPENIKRAAYPIAGTYNCRAVADTGQPSPHSYGIAIDLNVKFSDYWFWGQHADPAAYRNRMPEEIVAIFEKHGFIWGGKWYHFDTMHFEYRPELLAGSETAGHAR